MAGPFSGLMNYISQQETNRNQLRIARETNEANMQINQMNNDFNRVEAQKTRDFERMMFRDENAYNSAEAQMGRFADAGLNPAMMMSGQGAGIASGGSGGQASAASPISMQGASLKAPQMGDIFSQGFSSFLNSVQGFLKLPSEIGLLNSQKDMNKGNTNWAATTDAYKNFMTENSGLLAQINLETQEQQLAALQANANVAVAQKSLLELDADARGILNKYLDDEQKERVMLLTAQRLESEARTDLTREQITTEVKDQLIKEAKLNGIEISNRVAEQTAEQLIFATNAANRYKGAYDTHSMPFVFDRISDEHLGIYHDTENKKQTGEKLKYQTFESMFDAMYKGKNVDWYEFNHIAPHAVELLGDFLKFATDWRNGSKKSGSNTPDFGSVISLLGMLSRLSR